jgi:hypothetical protein
MKSPQFENQFKKFQHKYREAYLFTHVAACLALIDRYYNPAGVGVDNGGNGLSVVQELTCLDKYRPLGLKDRIRGFNFGSSTAVYLEDGKEVKKPTKEFMTSLISGCLQRREMILPITDQDIESQFTTHTYILKNGRIIYSKGNDHVVDSIRCAMLIRQEFQDDNDWNKPSTDLVMPVMTDQIFFF